MIIKELNKITLVFLKKLESFYSSRLSQCWIYMKKLQVRMQSITSLFMEFGVCGGALLHRDSTKCWKNLAYW
jgi:hypothetical protein